MSHWLPSISADDPSIAKDTRDYIINGRSRARIYNAERERSSIERRRSGGRGPINETWDRWFLEIKASDENQARLTARYMEEFERYTRTGALSSNGVWVAPPRDDLTA